ncbi:MAG TPA: hypothetical protein VK718_08750 [Ferruginibacter sp.]|jgi:hypothetical protein|nr:hypothetical protein [Ferruginibacter sp.]
MNKLNRDLMVLFNQDLMTPQAMEHEVELLHELLYNVERVDNLIIAYEVIDLNKYRISNKPQLLRKVFRSKQSKAFVFLNNKN